jgi:hypothetical protein
MLVSAMISFDCHRSSGGSRNGLTQEFVIAASTTRIGHLSRAANRDNLQEGFNMKVRTIAQSVIAVILLFVGWAVAKAQVSAPAFELVIDAPRGETTIKCVRGCELVWVERGFNANTSAMPSFTYRCTAPRCSSGRVGGWLVH